MIWKIWMKCEMIWEIGKKSKLNTERILENTEENCEMIWKSCEMIWKIGRNSKLNSKQIWKIQKKIVK
jgi:hypothetical protein